MNSLVVDFDDWGADHIISGQCRTRDCRTELLKLKEINPKFKVTLFAVPFEMTLELITWALDNSDWVELAVHGFTHSSNYECDKMTYEDMDEWMSQPLIKLMVSTFAKGFKAPGWQISDGCYEWLLKNGWWVADQEYNDNRRLEGLPVYKIGDSSWHGHTWNCVGNGIEETFDELSQKVADAKNFQFVSEVIR